MKKSTLKKISLGFVSATFIVFSSACVNENGNNVVSDNSNDEANDTTPAFSTDLALYELNGNVKEVTKTSYFDVSLKNEKYVIDSVAKNTVSTTIRFDREGKVIPRKNEKIKRDKDGRITRWEDNRPNAKGVHGGILKDTLEYKYMNGNHILNDGMGQYAVVVYDDDNKIVGQYTVPRLNDLYTSAFNVYKKFDSKGNWTERVTIWSTMTQGDAKPTINYSIDRRDIKYY